MKKKIFLGVIEKQFVSGSRCEIKKQLSIGKSKTTPSD